MSDTISLTLTPGYQLVEGEVLTIAILNALGTPTVDLTGAVGTLSLADGSVTTVKIASNALAASATGRGKMQDGFFAADATSRAKFVANFFGAGDATSLAFFATGFWTADATGRAKMADSFVTGAKLDATAAAVIASARNIIVKNTVATPNSKVDVTADELVLKDSSGKPYLTAVNVTADMAASGANGLDTGAEAADTWYYIWVIYNGTTVAGLISASSTSPTMPATYTHKALVGEVRNNASSNFATFYQMDRVVWLNDSNLFTAKAAGAGNTYESYQAGGGGADVDLRTVIPPTAKRLHGTCGCSVAGAAESMAIAADANGLGAVTVSAQALGSTLNGFGSAGQFNIPIKTAQTFYWKALDTNSRNRVNISGYSI